MNHHGSTKKFDSKKKRSMYQLNDDEELDQEVIEAARIAAPKHEEQKNANNSENYVKFVEAHSAAQLATQTKKACRKRIEEDMEKQHQKVVALEDHFFVRDAKVARVSLTIPFIQRGFLSFFQKRNFPVTDADAEAFGKYLEEKRSEHAVRQKSTVKYCKKRPPEAYFF